MSGYPPLRQFSVLGLFQQSSQARQQGFDFLRVEDRVVDLEYRGPGGDQRRILFDEGFQIVTAEFASAVGIG